MLIESDFPFLVIDFEGKQLTKQDAQLLSHPAVGGVVLFGRNDQCKEGLQKLCQSIKAIDNEIIIMVDQEGGRVQRLKEGCGALPELSALSKDYAISPKIAQEKVRQAGRACAAYIKSCGIDLNFAPVLDLHHESSQIIGKLGRAFHTDPDVVTDLAEIWISEHHLQGVLVTGKHFPNHGCVVGDTHLDVVVDDRPEAGIKSHDMIPYIKLQEKLDMVMTAHVIYTQCDDKPATLSPYWHNVLRNEIGYSGLVATDCLSMEGLQGNYSDNLNAALSAGCDYVLMCNCRDSVNQLMENDFKIKGYQALSRLKTRVESPNEP